MRDIIITATADVSALLNAMRTAGRSVMDMSGDVVNGGNAAARATDSFIGRMVSRLSSLGGNVIAGAVGGIAAAATAALGGAVAKGFDTAKSAVIDFNSTLQNADIGFTTMLGSGAKSKAFLSQLQAFAKATPFDFQGLVKNSQNLLGMGVAAKDIIPTLTGLGDSVASVGGGADQLNGVITAFGQTMAKGNLDMGNMQQMLEGGVPSALKILASSYGVTTGEMVKMISSGKVMSADALPRLIKGIEEGTSKTAALGGMMDKTSTTFSGSMANIGDAVEQTTAGAFKPLFDELTRNAQGLAAFLGSDKVSDFSKRFSTGLGAVIKRFDEFKPKVQAALGDLPAEFTALVDKVRPFADGISQAFSGSGGDLAKDALTIVQALSPLGAVLSGLAPSIVPLAAEAASLSKVLGSALSGAVSMLAPLLVGLLQVVVDIAVPMAQVPGLAQGIVLGLIAWKAASMGMAAANVIIAGYTAFTYGAAGATYASGAASKVYAGLMTAQSIATKIAAGSAVVLNAATAAAGWVARGAAAVGYGVAMGAVNVAQKAMAGGAALVNLATAGGAWVARTAGLVAYGVATTAVSVATKIAAAGQWLLNAAMTANPIGLIIAGIVLLVAGLTWFFTQTKVGKAILDAAFKGIAAAFKWVQDAAAAVFAWVGKNWPLILSIITGPIGAAVIFVISHWKQIQTATSAAFAAVKKVVSDVIGGIVGFVTDRVGDVVSNFKRGWNLIVSAVTSVNAKIEKAVSSLIDGIAGFITGGVSDFVSNFRRGWSLIVSAVTAANGRIVAAVSSVIGKVVAFFAGLGAKIKGAIGNAGSMLSTIGRQIIDGLVSGVRNAAGMVQAAVSHVIGLIPAGARKLLGIASPSKVFREIGRWVGVGLVKGLEGTADQVQSTMESLVSKVTSAFDKLADQREASQKRLKALDKSLAGTSTKTEAGRKRAAEIRDQIKEEQAELASINKTSKIKKSGLLQALERDTKDLQVLAKRRDDLVSQVKDAQSALESAMKERSDYGSSVASGAAGIGAIASTKAGQDDEGNALALTSRNIIDAKQDALNRTAKFLDTIRQLQAAGLNEDDYRGLVGAFQSSGDSSAADALLAGGNAAIAEVNDLNARLNAVAGDLGNQTSSHLYDAGVQSAQALVTGLTDQVTAVDGAMGAIELRVAQSVARLGINTSALANSAGGKIADALALSVQTRKDAVGPAVDDLSKSAQGAVEKLGLDGSKSAKKAGHDIIAGLKKGMSQKAVFDDLFDGMSDKMIGSLRKSLGIKSPSTRFRDEVGAHIPTGVIAGVEAGQADLERSVSNLVAIPTVKTSFEGSWSASGASQGRGGGGGDTVHNEFTIEVPSGAERDDVEYAENLLGQVRFAVGSTTGGF